MFILSIFSLYNLLFGVANYIHPTFSPINIGFFLLINFYLFSPGFFLAITKIKTLKEIFSIEFLFSLMVWGIIINIFATLTIILLNLPRNPKTFISILWILFNLVFFIRLIKEKFGSKVKFAAVRKSKNSIQKFGWKKLLSSLTILTVFILLCFAIYYVMLKGEIHFDLETFQIGSAYGLMEEFRPVIWPSVPDNTFKKINYSRPPLTHFYTAWSILLSGLLDESEPFYRNVFLPKENRPLPKEFWINNEKTQYPDEMIANAKDGGGKGVRIFVKSSVPISKSLLFSSRIPHTFLFCLSLIPFLFILKKANVTLIWQILGVLLFVSMPEVIIRGTSASVAAMTFFWSFMLTYFYLQPEDRDEKIFTSRVFWSAFILFWINQKAIVFAGGVFLLKLSQERNFNDIIKDKAIQGFMAGFIAYAFYGILCDPIDYFHAFLGEQGIFRYFLFKIHPPQDRIYPDVINLWLQFNTFLGNPFLFISAFYLIIQIFSRNKGKEAVFAFWFIVTAVLGSIIDRRMTRHLAVAIIPLVISFLIMNSKFQHKINYLLILITGYIIVSNGFLDWNILHHFFLVGPLPTW